MFNYLYMLAIMFLYCISNNLKCYIIYLFIIINSIHFISQHIIQNTKNIIVYVKYYNDTL